MSNSDRQPYLTATVLDQDFLDACHDNLACQLEMTADIQRPARSSEVAPQYIRASDRNKFKGSVFYKALTVFPVFRRTLGEWLAGTLQFSPLKLRVSNVDGSLNDVLPAGDDFEQWVGKEITVQMGLRDVSATYQTLFEGTIVPEGGFGRDVQAINLKYRDDLETVNRELPPAVFIRDDFPKIAEDLLGKGIPIIYGDWTVDLIDRADVPAIVVNGADPVVNGDDRDCLISVSSPAVVSLPNNFFDDADPIVFETDDTLPTGLSTGTTYYARNPTAAGFNVSATPAGPLLNTTGAGAGTHTVQHDPAASRRNVEFRVSDNDNDSIQAGAVWLLRGDTWYKIHDNDVVSVAGGNNAFEIVQDSGDTQIEGENFLYETGDTFWCRVVGKDLSGYESNAVEISRDILKTYGGLSAADFDSNWDTYRDKNSPGASAIFSIGCRVWQQDAITALELSLSLLEQVRLEAFVDRNRKFKINTLHFDDFPDPATIDHTVRNWDVARNSWKPQIDNRNNFNRARGAFNFNPRRGENARLTARYRNQSAIDATGRDDSKILVFPNLHVESDVENQTVEVIRMASSYFEVITTTLTWRSLLLDPGDFVKVNVQIGSSIYTDVPAMIREIGVDPRGFKFPAKLWSFQMMPYPNYEPGYSGTTGGYNATIDKET